MSDLGPIIHNVIMTGTPVTLTKEQADAMHAEFVKGVKPEIDRLRELVREAYENAYLLTLGGEWCERAEKALA